MTDKKKDALKYNIVIFSYELRIVESTRVIELTIILC